MEQAQLRLLGLWKEKQLVGDRLPAYDTTNFYTYIANPNTRNQLAQRAHNKQGPLQAGAPAGQSRLGDLSTETLPEELQQIQQFVLLYPREGEKGPDRAACVLSSRPWCNKFWPKAEVRRAADCPTWVRQAEYYRLYKNGCLQASLPNWQ